MLVIPYSCIRWISRFGTNDTNGIPDAATFTADFILGLSGAVNVALFLCTRPELLSLRGPPVRRRGLGIAPGVLLSKAQNASGRFVDVELGPVATRKRLPESSHAPPRARSNSF